MRGIPAEGVLRILAMVSKMGVADNSISLDVVLKMRIVFTVRRIARRDA